MSTTNQFNANSAGDPSPTDASNAVGAPILEVSGFSVRYG